MEDDKKHHNSKSKKNGKTNVKEEKQTLKEGEKKVVLQSNRIPHMKAPAINDKEKVMQSAESGFTGPADDWFDNNRFNMPKKAKTAASFNQSNKHDYYFNSYSSHHIHEEMLKD